MSAESRSPGSTGSQAYRDTFGRSAPVRRRWLAPVVVGVVALGIAIAILTWPRSDPPSRTPLVTPDAALRDPNAAGSGSDAAVLTPKP